MPERPIIFSGPMIRAIQDDSKTMTRRVITDQGTIPPTRCRYGLPGDRLWVKETWAKLDGGQIIYRADGTYDDTISWRSSLFMPKVNARLWLTITDIRVERLHDLTEADAQAEGITEPEPVHGPWCDPALGRQGHWSYRKPFADLWDSLHQKTYPWQSNCLVYVIRFERIFHHG